MEETTSAGGPPGPQPKKESTGNNSAPEPVSKTPALARRKRRRWPWVVGIILVLLIGLLLTLPTIISSGAGRSIVVSHVNEHLNGRLQVNDWSFGWATGIRLDGLIIDDASGRQILQLRHFSTGLTLLDALRGKFDLGKTEVEGLDILVSREADGALNWTHLAKTDSVGSGQKPSAPAEPSSTSKSPEPAKLPMVRGDVVVGNCTITYEDRSAQHQPTVYLRSVQAHVDIPDLNQTITDSFSATMQVGTAKPGTIQSNGTIAAVKDNAIAMNGSSIDQTLLIQGIDLVGFSTVLSAGQAPLEVTRGGATFTLKLNSVGGKVVVTPAITLADLELKRGKASFTAGSIDYNSEIVLMPVTGSASASGGFLDQLAEVQIAKLSLTAPSIGGLTVSLPEPIVVKNPASFSRPSSQGQGAEASVTGRLLVRGIPGPLLTLVSTISGESPAHKVDGVYAIDEQFAAGSGGAIQAKGRADLNDLVVDGHANPEKAWRVLSDVSLNFGGKLVDIQTFNVQATATNAINMVVKGRLADLGGQQQIDHDLTVDLAYDLARLWQILYPLMSAEQQKSYNDVEVAGKYQEQFVVSGAYPAGKPFNTAVQSLLAHGELQFGHFSTKSCGIALDNGAIPFDLQGGTARLRYFGKPDGQNLPTPITCNDGKINLGGLVADLRTEHILVSSPSDLQLMDKVSLNPVLAKKGLGDYLNNPLFVGASEATGDVSLLIHSCNQVAVDNLGVSEGKALLDLTIGRLQLGNPTLAKLLPGSLLNSLRGEVPAYHISIDHHKLTQDFTFVVLQQKRPIHLTGEVDLASKEMGSTTLDLPWALFGVGDKSLQKYLPDGIQIPFTGKSNGAKPGIDVNQMVQKHIGEAGKKYLQDQLLGGGKKSATSQPADNDPLKLLGGLLKGNKKSDATSQPAESEDPLKTLGDLLNRGKKKNEDGK